MTQTNVRVQMQIRRDTAANWNSANPQLLQAEWGYETDSGKIKIGDGSTAWQQLDYAFVSTKGGNMTDHFTIHSQKELRLSDHVQGGAQEHYSAFKAGVQSTNATYTLPTALPASSGQVLSCTDAGVMSWASDSTTDSTKMPLAGGSFVGDVIFDNATNAGNDMTWDMSDNALEFNDNVKAIFGTDSTGPLELFHHSSNWNIIRNKAAGGLFIESQEDQTGIEIYPDSWVKLRYAGGERLATTASGATITGSLTVDVGTTNNDTVCTLKNDSSSAYATTDGGINTPLSIYSDGTDSAQSVGIQFYLVKTGETGCISEIGAVRESSGNSNLVFRTRDSSTGRNERMRITSAGNVGIGTDDPFAPTNFTCLEISGTTGGCITFSDDEVEQWEIYGDSGDLAFYHRNHSPSAAIACINISANGNVSLPTGNLILTNEKGIDFAAQTTSGAGNVTPAESAGDELFNHYERGVWQPNDQSGAGLTFSLQTASYFKIGGLVFINCYFFYPTNSSSSDAIIGGLPFNNKSANYAFFTGRASGVTTALNVQTNSGVNTCSLFTADTQLSNSQLSGKYVLFSGCYPNV